MTIPLSKQRERDVKRAYAVLMLSHDILSKADDIEDLYNARKLFEYAFLANNVTDLLADNDFAFKAKKKFEFIYQDKSLIRHSVLDKKVTAELEESVATLLRKMRNSAAREMQIDEEVDYVFANKANFVDFARRYKDKASLFKWN